MIEKNHKVPSWGAITLKPFVYTTPSMHTILISTLVFLVPQLVMLFLTKTYSSLLLVLFSVLGSLLAEVVYASIRRTFAFSWMVAVIQGVLVGMLVPSTYSFAAIFFITCGCMLLVKYVFGGFSKSWINPVAVTIIVCYLVGAAFFPDFLIFRTDLETKNAVLSLLRHGAMQINPIDRSVTAFLNANLFKFVGIRIPEGYVTLFWDSGAIIPAFRFNFITIVSSLFFFAFDMMDILIPAIYVLVYSLMVKFAPVSLFIGSKLYGDIFLALLTSGVLFSTLYILQWYGTVPLSFAGKIVYAVVAGVSSFLIIGYGTSSIGYVFMVVCMNLVSLLIGAVEQHGVNKNYRNNLIPRIQNYREANRI